MPTSPAKVSQSAFTPPLVDLSKSTLKPPVISPQILAALKALPPPTTNGQALTMPTTSFAAAPKPHANSTLATSATVPLVTAVASAKLSTTLSSSTNPPAQTSDFSHQTIPVLPAHSLSLPPLGPPTSPAVGVGSEQPFGTPRPSVAKVKVQSPIAPHLPTSITSASSLTPPEMVSAPAASAVLPPAVILPPSSSILPSKLEPDSTPEPSLDSSAALAVGGSSPGPSSEQDKGAYALPDADPSPLIPADVNDNPPKPPPPLATVSVVPASTERPPPGPGSLSSSASSAAPQNQLDSAASMNKAGPAPVEAAPPSATDTNAAQMKERATSLPPVRSRSRQRAKTIAESEARLKELRALSDSLNQAKDLLGSDPIAAADIIDKVASPVPLRATDANAVKERTVKELEDGLCKSVLKKHILEAAIEVTQIKAGIPATTSPSSKNDNPPPQPLAPNPVAAALGIDKTPPQPINPLVQLPEPSNDFALRLQIWKEMGWIEELTDQERVDRMKVECHDRDDEVECIANQIGCANKNCVIVQAKPGTGKTTLMNYIAALVMKGGEAAPLGFRNKRIFLITKPNPKVVLNIVQEIDRHFSEGCILFCDEVHQIFPVNDKRVAILNNDAEVLKPYLGDGRVTLVGFTDRAHGHWGNDGFLDDPAWGRRFNELVLSNMSIKAVTKIIEKVIPTLEKKFEKKLGKPLVILPKAVECAVKLADLFYPRQQFPDKVSHILEPACAAKLRADKTGDRVLIDEADILDFVMHKRKPAANHDRLKRGMAEVELRSKLKDIPADSDLLEFCEDLTVRAATGDLQPAYGRDKIMQQLIKTFSAGVSNNAVLYGPHGCGKTRIAYGFACMVARGEVPEHLQGMHVLLLDLCKLLGDTPYRGMLEKRMNDFLRSAKEHKGKFILFVDEFHMVAGAGATVGNESGHVANFLKTALADGDLPMVGMTNEPQVVRRDGAFARRFRFYEVPLFTADETRACINKEKAHIESHYSQKAHRPFTIDASAIEAAVRLGQVMPDENLPASALKLLDLACGEILANAHELSVNRAKPVKAAAGLVVTTEDIIKAAEEAVASTKQVAPKPAPASQEEDPRALADRITRKAMSRLPPDIVAFAGPLMKECVSNAIESAADEEPVAAKKTAKASAAPAPQLTAEKLMRSVVRKQSTCAVLGMLLYEVMSRIAEFFLSIFYCCSARKSAEQAVVSAPEVAVSGVSAQPTSIVVR